MSNTRNVTSLKSTTTIRPQGGTTTICHLDEEDPENTPSNNGRKHHQSTLHSFIVGSKKRPRKVTPEKLSTANSPVSEGRCNGTVSEPLPPSKSKRLQQVYLDCGQSDLGQKICGKCGMLYVPGVLEDMKAHATICRERCEGILWRTVRGQKIHRMSSTSEDSMIVSLPIVTTTLKKQVTVPIALEHVFQQVIEDLGLDVTTSISSSWVGCTIWMYLRNQRIVGFLITEPISEAFPLLDGNNGLSLSTMMPMKVMLGISILWTHDRFRHQRIATDLVTTARQHSFFGMIVPINKVAFSTPTQAGWSFAKKYCGSSNPCPVLGYRYQPTKEANNDCRPAGTGSRDKSID